MPVDLHVHSTASDGSLTPTEVVDRAVALGLSAVALADHDTLAGVPEGQSAAAGRLDFLPALEISTHHGYHELHLLGYMVDLDYQPLLDELTHIQQERVLRCRRTVQILRELGVELEFEEVLAVAGDGTLGRPHVASALVNRGAVKNPAQAFERYLRRGRPAYVDRYRLSPLRAIELIRAADGLPVLAHPRLVRRDGLLPELVQGGLGGLEAHHSQHTPHDVERYLRLAEKYHLVVTGGTDSHGPAGSAPVEIGAVMVPDECARRVLTWKEQRSAWRQAQKGNS